MSKRKAVAEALTRWAVHSVNSNALVCGPYESETDAKRECDRLNREAATGRTAPSERHPTGQRLSALGEQSVMHDRQPQQYELREVVA